ncbi:MAG: IS5 family transposase [Candidatus Pacearchaeota archaeon]|nr:IS5 family transposase [Candidatus Pacearchaeota archaeon]
MEKQSELKTFLVSARNLINKIPKFSSKFSNKIYDNHQKMIILVFKQKMRMTYRGIIKFFNFSYIARALLNLKSVPDHSTLVKFNKRINVTILDGLLCKKEVITSAIDSSGFETNYMSYHYANVWNRQDKRKYRRYLKVSIAIDTDSQYILSQKMRLGPRNDNIDFETVMKDVHCKYVVADKGYDSKSNRRFVLKNMKSYPHIPYRKISGRMYEKLGVPLKFNEKIYHQRSKVETVFSVIKRKYGSSVLSRSFETQKRELLFRMIAYNIDRKIILSLVIIGIHQSLFP